MSKISGHGIHEWKWNKLAKLSKGIKIYVVHVGNIDRKSENNEIVDKFKTGLLKFAREQMQNK